MTSVHPIVEKVELAKANPEKAGKLISEYLPFIKSETSKYLNRSVIEGQDEELSVAMLAFHEAIHKYEEDRGAFLPFASMLIKSRLIDNSRKQERHNKVISLDLPVYGEEDETTLGDTLQAQGDQMKSFDLAEASRQEIAELSQELAGFGVTFSDIAENSPKQDRTLAACQDALRYAVKNPSLIARLLEKKQLPITDLANGSGVAKKTLERHRNYMVALLVIYSNGYDIIRDHISQVMKGGDEG